MSTWVSPYREGRRYILSFPATTSVAPFASLNGTLRQGFWTPQSTLHSLRKAQRSGYRAVVFPAHALEHAAINEFISAALELGMQVNVQIHRGTSLPNLLALQQRYPLTLEYWCETEWPEWSTLAELSAAVEVKIVARKKNPLLTKWQNIPPSFRERCEFYIPHQDTAQKRLSPRAVMRFIESVQKTDPSFQVRATSGIDLYESRIPEAAELEPIHGPIYQSPPRLQPKVSVVIPVYNNGLYLLNTLRHLEKQTVSPETYEVVIVDDGSSDRISESLPDLIKEMKIPITLLYYPRLRKRQMGDSQFRAGLARNYGVKFARGEILAFLDSDILTPSDFIAKTQDLHRQHQVVQWRREYLRQEFSSANQSYEAIQLEKQCYVPEQGYWHRFYKDAEEKGWQNIPDGWKYACTYAFSMHKKTFQDAGWFRKTFCFYGLEDTDLGWRLAKGGYSFHLESTPVYHLYHEDIRSEFFNSSFRRQKLLKSTAEIFFYNNLSPDIYRVFQYLLNSWIF